MPPKKKRLPVNSVIGTVSTRSTRRQSIVNIEIPKTSRGKIQKLKQNKPASTNTIKTRKQTSSNDNSDILRILEDWDEKDDSNPFEESSVKSEPISDDNSISNSVEGIETSESSTALGAESDNLRTADAEQTETICLDSGEDEITIECVTEEIVTMDDNHVVMIDESEELEVSAGSEVHNDPLDITNFVSTDAEETPKVPVTTDEIVPEQNPLEDTANYLNEPAMNSEETVKISSTEEVIVCSSPKREEFSEMSTETFIVEASLACDSDKIVEVVEPQIERSDVPNQELDAATEITHGNISDELLECHEDNTMHQGQSDGETLDDIKQAILESEDTRGSENNTVLPICSSVLENVQPAVEEGESIVEQSVEENLPDKNNVDLETDTVLISASSSFDYKQEKTLPVEEKIESFDYSAQTVCEEIQKFTKEQNIDEDDTNDLESKITHLQIKDEIEKKIVEETKETENSQISTVSITDEKTAEIENKIMDLKLDEVKTVDTESTQAAIKTESPEKLRKTDDKSDKHKSKKRPLKELKPKSKPPKDKKIKEIKLKEYKSQKEPKPKKSSSTKKHKSSEKNVIPKKSASEYKDDDLLVRRSSRIKSINVLKKRCTGHGLVRSKSESLLNDSDISESSNSGDVDKNSSPKNSKSSLHKIRSSKSTENLSSSSESPQAKLPSSISSMEEKVKMPVRDKEVETRLKQFVHLKENLYLTDRLSCKEAKKMTCDCFLTEEDIQRGEYGCGEDCLNRLLMIECGGLCPVSERCTNKRFQKAHFAPVEVFKTEKKGLGLRAAANIPYGDFILEYVGEVLNPEEFDKRADIYSCDKNIHYYFMSLRADAIIDATMKGNISRFINHSCDPNAETQKWTVNGELRIGFFSTRTILAGEEITFDYRFQRYGKEAQKCYCEAATCRGWLGEEPDDEESEEEEEEEETEEADEKTDSLIKDKDVEKLEETPVKETTVEKEPKVVKKTKKVKSPRKKPRKEFLEDLDLEEEIEMLLTTGLKNQAHTLKLSRLMVRAKEPAERAKLLRILRRGELPCRRLFLDYHGLRLIHGYMTDALHLVHTDKKYESLRLEILQTLATLPIPNKTMLQDSKVLSTVDLWSVNKDVGSPLDSDSNSPKCDATETVKKEADPNVVIEPVDKEPEKFVEKPLDEVKKDDEEKPDDAELNYQEEILALALKLLEEWSNLKEVFRIPKKERIEQMKEHEREANKKFIAGGYGAEPDPERKTDRYRLGRYKSDRDSSNGNRKGTKFEERNNSPFARLSKYERRKIFALQVELKEEERRLKQREMWRQHEQNCMVLGTDPRFTAPFDPSRGFQCIWNPQIGQWQNYPLPSHPPTSMSLPSLPNVSVPPPQVPKNVPGYPFLPTVPQMGQIINLPQAGMPGLTAPLPPPASSMAMQINYPETIKEDDPSQVKFMGPIPPPVKLPLKWKCAKDKYGRPYYYHVKVRISQWEPPPFVLPIDDPDASSESSSSSDTSTLTSDSSSENSDSDDDLDDTKLLMEVRKQMEKSAKLNVSKNVAPVVSVKIEEASTPSPEEKEEKVSDEEVLKTIEEDSPELDEKTEAASSIDIRLKEQFDLLKDDSAPPSKKRRTGLVQEIIISPRTEEDRMQFREDLKRYKQNKEKLKRQKELILQQTKKQLREAEPKKPKEKRARNIKSRIKEMTDFNSDAAKRIKESFRTNMATVVVSVLNSYRKPDCKEGRITNTEDFKHLARKLTHFVMLKEIKHITNIEELVCTDNVKTKAREYIKKYMSKFGENYQKRNDEPDFKD